MRSAHTRAGYRLRTFTAAPLVAVRYVGSAAHYGCRNIRCRSAFWFVPRLPFPVYIPPPLHTTWITVAVTVGSRNCRFACVAHLFAYTTLPHAAGSPGSHAAFCGCGYAVLVASPFTHAFFFFFLHTFYAATTLPFTLFVLLHTRFTLPHGSARLPFVVRVPRFVAARCTRLRTCTFATGYRFTRCTVGSAGSVPHPVTYHYLVRYAVTFTFWLLRLPRLCLRLVHTFTCGLRVRYAFTFARLRLRFRAVGLVYRAARSAHFAVTRLLVWLLPRIAWLLPRGLPPALPVGFYLPFAVLHTAVATRSFTHLPLLRLRRTTRPRFLPVYNVTLYLRLRVPMPAVCRTPLPRLYWLPFFGYLHVGCYYTLVHTFCCGYYTLCILVVGSRLPTATRITATRCGCVRVRTVTFTFWFNTFACLHGYGSLRLYAVTGLQFLHGLPVWFAFVCVYYRLLLPAYAPPPHSGCTTRSPRFTVTCWFVTFTFLRLVTVWLHTLRSCGSVLRFCLGSFPAHASGCTLPADPFTFTLRTFATTVAGLQFWILPFCYRRVTHTYILLRLVYAHAVRVCRCYHTPLRLLPTCRITATHIPYTVYALVCRLHCVLCVRGLLRLPRGCSLTGSGCYTPYRSVYHRRLRAVPLPVGYTLLTYAYYCYRVLPTVVHVHAITGSLPRLVALRLPLRAVTAHCPPHTHHQFWFAVATVVTAFGYAGSCLLVTLHCATHYVLPTCGYYTLPFTPFTRFVHGWVTCLRTRTPLPFATVWLRCYAAAVQLHRGYLLPQFHTVQFWLRFSYIPVIYVWLRLPAGYGLHTRFLLLRFGYACSFTLLLLPYALHTRFVPFAVRSTFGSRFTGYCHVCLPVHTRGSGSFFHTPAARFCPTRIRSGSTVPDYPFCVLLRVVWFRLALRYTRLLRTRLLHGYIRSWFAVTAVHARLLLPALPPHTAVTVTHGLPVVRCMPFPVATHTCTVALLRLVGLRTRYRIRLRTTQFTVTLCGSTTPLQFFWLFATHRIRGYGSPLHTVTRYATPCGRSHRCVLYTLLCLCRLRAPRTHACRRLPHRSPHAHRTLHLRTYTFFGYYLRWLVLHVLTGYRYHAFADLPICHTCVHGWFLHVAGLRFGCAGLVDLPVTVLFYRLFYLHLRFPLLPRGSTHTVTCGSLVYRAVHPTTAFHLRVWFCYRLYRCHCTVAWLHRFPYCLLVLRCTLPLVRHYTCVRVVGYTRHMRCRIFAFYGLVLDYCHTAARTFAHRSARFGSYSCGCYLYVPRITLPVLPWLHLYGYAPFWFTHTVHVYLRLLGYATFCSLHFI